MHYEKRSNSNGTVYYRFTFYNPKTGKPDHMTKDEVRRRFGKDITTEDEAEECLKLLSAQFESEKVRIERRLNWEKEFYNFKGLLDQYALAQKKNAPNSWKNNVHYLKHYVLYFFLTEKRLNNIEIWGDHFAEFRDYLLTATTLRGKEPIAYASKNHAIKALNTFMEHLLDQKLITSAPKCETFPEHLLNERGIDDVVSEEEMETIFSTLAELGYVKEAHYFRFLYFSGMRFNEGLCISVGDMFQGEIEHDFMRRKLTAYGIAYYGYIVSDGQLDRVDLDGKVIRCPFKGKKKIDEKWNRIFPITDKTLWNIMVDYAEQKYSTKSNKRDILIFDGIDDAKFARCLLEAFEKAKLKHRSPHCLRHSRATFIIGQTADAMLARIWLGHTSAKTLEKYNHIYQAIARAAKAKDLTGETFKLTRA